ncbi:MAG: RagB/SusD family nutrient uptake outer membrane protein [Gemmatimonadetes bacterium]|nr:RagB/SusD family nutrient uptake outer membrane protein [Gemmatimonadota bacterium]
MNAHADTSMTQTRRIPAGSALAALTALLLAGCDVTNPGPVQDQFLDLAEAHQALVNGSPAALSGALGNIAIIGAHAAREVFPTGETSGCCSAAQQAGSLLSNGSNGAGVVPWSGAQQSRWIAEDAIKRFTALGAGKVNASTFAQAYLWAGYANRTLGENFCDAVFDGGPKEANAKYFERALAHFSKAIETGSGNDKVAGYAGRASVRVWLKDWAGAVSDAQQVPIGFVQQLITDIAAPATRNEIYYINANAPYRSYSGFQTWYKGYYDSTGDPRVPWATDARFPNGNATLSGYGPVPWSFQQKFTANNSPIRVSTGREMVLIRAEALLNAGNFQGAMTLINGLRTVLASRTTNQPLAPWTAANITDAWTFLKRERGIELYLEGRRLGDIRRWDENKTPGVLDWPNFEALSSLFRSNPPSKCFPIPDNEIETNVNF